MYVLKYTRFLYAVIISMACMISAHAEHIFLKDGRIVEGAITSENDNEITVNDNKGVKTSIKRKDVLRILFSSDYKTKMFIILKNGEEIEAHIVAEDRESITTRKNITDSIEMIYPKMKVVSTSKKSLADTRPPFIALYARPEYLYPLFKLGRLGKHGVGGIAGIDWINCGGTRLRLGLHAGCWYLYPKSNDTENLLIAPITARLGYEFFFARWFALVPRIDIGASYNRLNQRKWEAFPRIIPSPSGRYYVEFIPFRSKQSRERFEPLFMIGLDLMFMVRKDIAIQVGSQYGMLVEKKAVLHLLVFHTGVEGRI